MSDDGRQLITGLVRLSGAVFGGMMGVAFGHAIGAGYVVAATLNSGYGTSLSTAQDVHTILLWVGGISGAVFCANLVKS